MKHYSRSIPITEVQKHIDTLIKDGVFDSETVAKILCEKYDITEHPVEEDVLAIHDIRNKLSPITNLIYLIEKENLVTYKSDEVKFMFSNSIKTSKKCINYLCNDKKYK